MIKETDDGTASTEHVSILPPLHVLCSDVVEMWAPTLKVTNKACLPYQKQGGSKLEEVNFEQKSVSIRNALSSWHTDSLNELEDDEKGAVQNMKPRQLSYFSKLMEQRDYYYRSIWARRVPIYYGSGNGIFLWQLGYHSDPFKLDHVPVTRRVMDDMLAPMPLCDAPSPPYFHGYWKQFGTYVHQASLHADNWLALEAGHFPFSCSEAKDAVSEAEVSTMGKSFQCTE